MSKDDLVVGHGASRALYDKELASLADLRGIVPRIKEHDAEIRAAVIGELDPWLKHDGNCAALRYHGDCTCGLEEAKRGKS